MTVRPRSPASAPLVLALALGGCGYQPTLLGGGQPEDAAVPGSAWTVVYTASCQGGGCEATYTTDRELRSAEFEGAWQERVRIRWGGRRTATLTVRPLDDVAVVRRAGIDVDGRRAARGEAGPQSALTLTAELQGPTGGNKSLLGAGPGPD